MHSKYLSSPPVFSGVRVAQSLVVVCRSLCVLFRLVIVLSVDLRLLITLLVSAHLSCKFDLALSDGMFNSVLNRGDEKKNKCFAKAISLFNIFSPQLWTYDNDN
jgi:hypothetical protein